MRKKLLFGLLFAAMTAGAVKMKPGINIIKQADGTTITESLRRRGLELFPRF
mgnify:CR=1 FL=1